MSESEAFTMNYSCNYKTAKMEMACVVSMGGEEANDLAVSTGTLTGSEISFLIGAVTAGGEIDCDWGNGLG
ncbi:hypothetical protein K469DRAFT_785594 [Zopfia rhizophila CBS 207.26]|uniref:Uncharacterized protein n=1 Tax=Zopfia rhizophila CBS 207.26 TaxID=1314779 RepID=A0A6A6DUX9_9PEZI|nr:hypothetical protein K469DRAFT_785594 [Zopfia rhizophila CBS 207.26]